MDDIVKIIIIMVAVIGPLIAGGIKKAADKKAKEKLDEAKRQYGDPKTSPKTKSVNSYTQYGAQQKQTPPTSRAQYRPQPTPKMANLMPPHEKIVLDEEAQAHATHVKYGQYAPREVSQEHAQPSFDKQFKGDVAVGKVGETQLLSEKFKAFPKQIGISSFDAEKKPTTAAPNSNKKAQNLLGSFKGLALKRAIVMKEILGPPKALEM